MGAFFTNIQIRVPAGDDPAALAGRVRACVLERLRAEGFREATPDDGSHDREILLVPSVAWIALYDARSEDQDTTATDWARALSGALATDAFSVLVHDSDVLDLALFAKGKQRDHYDSNPSFSGKQPSAVTPEARAKKWAHLLAPGRSADELASVFAYRGTFAERALDVLAPALAVEPALLCTGYNYLHRDTLPAGLVRLCVVLAKRPPWERRLSGPPVFRSIWDQYNQMRPELPPQSVLEGQPLHVTTQAMNRGGAARGLRVEIACEGDAVALREVEAVVTLPGRHHMQRCLAPLVREGALLVAEFPDVELQPGMPADQSLLQGAPMQAMFDASQAGKVHLNILGETVHAGGAALAVHFIPHANPAGEYVGKLDVDVLPVRGAPLRVKSELHPHELERLTKPAHTYLLLLFDAPVEQIKQHVLSLLETVRFAWPKSHWTAFATNDRHYAGDPIKLQGMLGQDRVWSTLENAIRTCKRTIATSAPTPNYSTDDASSFELQLFNELGAFALSLAASSVSHERAAKMLVPVVDELARAGVLVQAVLARWAIDHLSIETPYEAVVGIQGDETATRSWATRWIRAIGPGQLWLGTALRDRAAAVLPRGEVELGPAVRIPVDNVAAVERALASLLPTEADFHAYFAARRAEATPTPRRYR